MISRYSLPEMEAVWSEARRLALWQEVEALALEAWEKLGVAPAGAAASVRAAPAVDATAWREREAVTGHDVAAFVDVLAASMSQHGEWLHYGLTSSDVIDTAQGRILADAAKHLTARAAELFRVVRQRAFEQRDTAMVGRTHGVWAEPTTLGLKLATWAFETARAHRRLVQTAETVAVGKIAGAVGTYASVPPAVEAHVLGALGLAPEPAPSQITHRDRHAEYLATLALVGASLERFATEIRHLARSEVGEVRERFGRGQKGSSAMPHKRNPIGAENVTGLARLLRGYAQAGFENVALWHERDISHSSVERIALPDASQVLDFALARMTELVEGLEIDDARIAANLEATRGLIHSQTVLLRLVEAGLDRDEAYRLVQRSALAAWDEGRGLAEVLAADPDVPLTPAELASCFVPDLTAAAIVFQRLEDVSLESGSTKR